MRASFSSETFPFRRASLRIVLIFTLALPALLLPMSNAFAQREIVEMNNQVIRLYQSGQKTEAIALAEKSVEKSRATLGADNKITATLTSQLGNFYREVGRFADAEKTLKTAVAILERNGASANFELAGALNNLGGVYLNQEMYPETEALFRRSLAIAEKLPAGKMRDYQRGNSMNSLAVVYGNQANALADDGQTGEANAAYDKMIAMLNEVIPIWSKVFGPTNQAVANLVANRGEAYSKKQQYDRAEADLREALKVRQQALGPKHQAVATVQNNLANALVAEKKYPEAEQLLLTALATRTEVLGPNHPSTARNLDALSRLYAASGNTAAAVDYSRKATGAVIAHAQTETALVRQQQGSGGLVEQRTPYFVLHVANLAAARAANPAPELDNEALMTAQWAAQSSTAAAVQQLGVRLASGGDAIAALVRDSQDTSALWRDRDRALIAEMSKPTTQQNRGGVDALRKQIAQLEDKQKTLQAKIETDFPDYAALSSPRPLNVDNVQKLLRGDEALVFFLAGDKESYVFALTHDAFDWRVIPFNRQQLSDKVAAFRRGLDVDALNKSISDGKPVLFNLDTAYELYSQLLRPVEATIKDKTNLAVVPSGALTALPFHLLVTDKPAGAAQRRQERRALPRRRLAVAASRRHRAAVGGEPARAALGEARRQRRAAVRRLRRSLVSEHAGPEKCARRRQDARLCRVLDAKRHRSRHARLLAATSPGHCRRDQENRRAARRLRERHLSRRCRERDERQEGATRQLPRGLLCDSRAHRGRRQGRRRAVACAVDPRKSDRDRRWPVDLERSCATQAQCRLGGAVGLQHGSRRQARRGSPVGTGARLLLCRHPRAAGVALGGRYRSGAAPDHLHLRHHGQGCEHRPRRGAAPRDAGLSR